MVQQRVYREANLILKKKTSDIGPVRKPLLSNTIKLFVVKTVNFGLVNDCYLQRFNLKLLLIKHF